MKNYSTKLHVTKQKTRFIIDNLEVKFQKNGNSRGRGRRFNSKPRNYNPQIFCNDNQRMSARSIHGYIPKKNTTNAAGLISAYVICGSVYNWSNTSLHL